MACASICCEIFWKKAFFDRVGSHFQELLSSTGVLSAEQMVDVVVIMTSSNGNIFPVTDPLCGEFTGHRLIPLTKASDEELWCFLWSAPWINGWVNNPEAGDLRRHYAHYDVIVMDGPRQGQLSKALLPSWVALACLLNDQWNSFNNFSNEKCY